MNTQASPDLPATGRLDGGEHRYALRVYFEDTDPAGVVYHANYLRFMERARTEYLRLIGIDHGAHVAGGEGAYAVADCHLRFRAPARLDDALVIVSRPGRIRAAGVVVHQEVRRDALLLVEATITLALVSPAGRPVRQPPAWVTIFEGLAGPNSADQGAPTAS